MILPNYLKKHYLASFFTGFTLVAAHVLPANEMRGRYVNVSQVHVGLPGFSCGAKLDAGAQADIMDQVLIRSSEQ
jgi:hypothetical protein